MLNFKDLPPQSHDNLFSHPELNLPAKKLSGGGSLCGTRLLLWYGTAVGKTYLLNHAEITNASLISNTPAHSGLVVPSDDLTKASVVHKGSVDLSAASSLLGSVGGESLGNVWVADVHVHADLAEGSLSSVTKETNSTASSSSQGGEESTNGLIAQKRNAMIRASIYLITSRKS